MSTEITTSAPRSAPLTVLGETRPMRIPVTGKIRPGIKVLTSSAQGNAQAKKIYEDGLAKGLSFDAIEREIVSKCSLKSPLTPRNVPWFTVRACDFAMPEIADQIMDLYGEDRKDGHGRHLYRFPVIFAQDAWQSVMPHGFHCYSRSELQFWSQYGEDGHRYCMYRQDVQVDPKSKRAHRTFGGRKTATRGLCHPDECPEYQQRKCNMTGSLQFYIPGITGSSGVIEVPTTSIYALMGARETMEMISMATGGRIAGLFNGRSIFYLTKRQKEVSRIDPETGKPKKVKQWLIALDADMGAKAFGGGTEGETAQNETVAGEPDYTEREASEVDTQDAQADTIASLRAEVMAGLSVAEIDAKAFAAYGVTKWGADWGHDEAALRMALADIEAGLADMEAYKAVVLA